VDWWEPLQRVGHVVLVLLPLGLWCVWWLWAVDWRKTWPALARGAWAPVLLLMFLTAGVWSRVAPGGLEWVPLLPNFYRQLTVVGTLVGIALFCGWLQGRYGWVPTEINLEPPPAAHGDDHHLH
jgi:hypothetical protein